MFSEELNRFINIQIDIEKDQLASLLTDSISKAFKETARSGWPMPQGFTIQKIIDVHGEFINSFSDSVWNSHVLAVKEFNLPANEDLIKDIKKSLEFYLSNLNIDWYRTLKSSGHTLPEDEIESGNEEIEEIKYGAYITKIREAESFVILLKQQQKMAYENSKNKKSTPVDITKHHFKVALSFPGEVRDYIKLVVEELERIIGANSCFYDNNYKAQLARPSLDNLLQDIYKNRSNLVVVFLCEKYEEKEWCCIEFRAIKEIIMQKQQHSRVMFIKMDNGEVQGVFKTDGYIDGRSHSPVEVAGFIQERIDLLE